MRQKFPFFEVNSLVYLDSAATAHKPQVVLQLMDDWYRSSNANVHRGVYAAAELATEQYEQARETIAKFVGAKLNEIVFTAGATAGLNTIAYACQAMLKPGDIIVTTELEHHANIIPWQMLAKRTGAELMYIPVDQQGQLQIESLEHIITDRVKIVTFSIGAHAIGSVIPVKEIIVKAQAVGALICVDAAQAIAHQQLDFAALGIDVAVFSGHKMYGPLGIGVLYCNRRIHHQLNPFMTGGGMVEHVTKSATTFKVMPVLLEPGTPPIVQALGLAVAFDFIANTITYPVLQAHERMIATYAYQELSLLEGVELYGVCGHHIIAFNVKGWHAHDIAAYLNTYQIAVRAGTHCSHILAERIGLLAWVRVSIALYTTKDDVDRLVLALRSLLF